MIPDVTHQPKAPPQDQIRKWVTVWRAVHFRYHGDWRVGIIKSQVQLLDGSWLVHIEYASDGMHSHHPATIWAVADRALIRALPDSPDDNPDDNQNSNQGGR